MLPSQFTLQEEGHVAHDRITSKKHVLDTCAEVRHRQRLKRPAGLRVGPRDGLHLAVGREEALVAARWSSIFSAKDRLVRRDPARRGAGIIFRVFEGLLRLESERPLPLREFLSGSGGSPRRKLERDVRQCSTKER